MPACTVTMVSRERLLAHDPLYSYIESVLRFAGAHFSPPGTNSARMLSLADLEGRTSEESASKLFTSASSACKPIRSVQSPNAAQPPQARELIICLCDVKKKLGLESRDTMDWFADDPTWVALTDYILAWVKLNGLVKDEQRTDHVNWDCSYSVVTFLKPSAGPAHSQDIVVPTIGIVFIPFRTVRCLTEAQRVVGRCALELGSPKRTFVCQNPVIPVSREWSVVTATDAMRFVTTNIVCDGTGQATVRMRNISNGNSRVLCVTDVAYTFGIALRWPTHSCRYMTGTDRDNHVAAIEAILSEMPKSHNHPAPTWTVGTAYLMDGDCGSPDNDGDDDAGCVVVWVSCLNIRHAAICRVALSKARYLVSQLPLVNWVHPTVHLAHMIPAFQVGGVAAMRNPGELSGRMSIGAVHHEFSTAIRSVQDMAPDVTLVNVRTATITVLEVGCTQAIALTLADVRGGGAHVHSVDGPMIYLLDAPISRDNVAGTSHYDFTGLSPSEVDHLVAVGILITPIESSGVFGSNNNTFGQQQQLWDAMLETLMKYNPDVIFGLGIESVITSQIIKYCSVSGARFASAASDPGIVTPVASVSSRFHCRDKVDIYDLCDGKHNKTLPRTHSVLDELRRLGAMKRTSGVRWLSAQELASTWNYSRMEAIVRLAYNAIDEFELVHSQHLNTLIYDATIYGVSIGEASRLPRAILHARGMQLQEASCAEWCSIGSTGFVHSDEPCSLHVRNGSVSLPDKWKYNVISERFHGPKKRQVVVPVVPDSITKVSEQNSHIITQRPGSNQTTFLSDEDLLGVDFAQLESITEEQSVATANPSALTDTFESLGDIDLDNLLTTDTISTEPGIDEASGNDSESVTILDLTTTTNSDSFSERSASRWTSSTDDSERSPKRMKVSFLDDEETNHPPVANAPATHPVVARVILPRKLYDSFGIWCSYVAETPEAAGFTHDTIRAEVAKGLRVGTSYDLLKRVGVAKLALPKGTWTNVFTRDMKSAYPTMISEGNLCPSTLVHPISPLYLRPDDIEFADDHLGLTVIPKTRKGTTAIKVTFPGTEQTQWIQFLCVGTREGIFPRRMRMLLERRENAQRQARQATHNGDEARAKYLEFLARKLKIAMVSLLGILASDSNGEGRQLCTVPCRLVYDAIIARIKHQMLMAEIGLIFGSNRSETDHTPLLETVSVIGRNLDSVSFIPEINWIGIENADTLSEEQLRSVVDDAITSVLNIAKVELISERICSVIYVPGNRNLRVEYVPGAASLAGQHARLVLTPGVGRDECVFVRATCALVLAIGDQAQDNHRYVEMADVLRKAVHALRTQWVLLTELCEGKIIPGNNTMRVPCVRVVLQPSSMIEGVHKHVHINDVIRNWHCVDVEYYVTKLKTLFGSVLEAMRVHENLTYPTQAPPGSTKLLDAQAYIFESGAEVKTECLGNTPTVTDSDQILLVAAARLGWNLEFDKDRRLVTKLGRESVSSVDMVKTTERTAELTKKQFTTASDLTVLKHAGLGLFSWIPTIATHTCNRFVGGQSTRTCVACGMGVFSPHLLTVLETTRINLVQCRRLVLGGIVN